MSHWGRWGHSGVRLQPVHGHLGFFPAHVQFEELRALFADTVRAVVGQYQWLQLAAFPQVNHLDSWAGGTLAACLVGSGSADLMASRISLTDSSALVVSWAGLAP